LERKSEINSGKVKEVQEIKRETSRSIKPQVWLNTPEMEGRKF